eukprot:NODE_262_length_12566_cov_0.133392.p4 type:complete len:354 gc:universal NODE_262_length_12566_cov_0.133392:6864-5803(-)
MLYDTLNDLDDLRISRIRPLLPPEILLEEIPLTENAALTIKLGRNMISRILNGTDNRLLVVIGPCSIHDPASALEYAKNLEAISHRFPNLFLVMRVYFEKPRTTVGWKGLINDPNLDGSFKINEGLRIARRLLRDINEIGLPCAVEFLDTISPQFIADLVSWGAIGARTTESQIHRELSSGLSMPIGFKNSTSGDYQICIDALMASRSPHCFLSVTKQGLTAIVETTGNQDVHVILRGSKKGPNYDQKSVLGVVDLLEKNDLTSKIMVDCSHGNSQKQYKKQVEVVNSLCESRDIIGKNLLGVMIESNLVEGSQKLNDSVNLVYGKSITDACIGWSDTELVLKKLNDAWKDFQ